jgi:hypothetical protein
MAYTSALGADAARRGGSSPLLGTSEENILYTILNTCDSRIFFGGIKH